MTPIVAVHVFMMLVHCAPGASTCRVQYARGIYPTLAECQQAAPTWVWGANIVDKDAAQGALCELARRPPASYLVDACDVPGAYCGQQEQHREARHQAHTDKPEDPKR